MDRQFQIRVQDYARPNGGIVFPNPNAPTESKIGGHHTYLSLG
jgi:histidinol-phosphate aminotransferase